MNAKPGRKRKGYGLFVMAAAIYSAGVIAFSVWSYLQQRSNLLAQVDQALFNATHSTEQILGDIFISCAVQTETPYELGYASNKKNLNRFAEHCHFDVLGAVGHKGGKQWGLIFGGKQTETMPADDSHVQDLLRTQLFPMVGKLATSGDETTRMQTVDLGASGELRVAIRFRPISADTGYAILVARSTQDVNQMLRSLCLRSVGMGIFLYAMVFPLMVLYHYAQSRSSRETAQLHTLLKKDFAKLKEREVELKDAIHDLERFNSVAIGRESRIIELKAEVNTLLEQLKQHKRYNVDHVE
jgi:hypothetical protein